MRAFLARESRHVSSAVNPHRALRAPTDGRESAWPARVEASRGIRSDKRDRAREPWPTCSARSPLAAIASSARRCATARSSTRTSSRPQTCRSAGRTTQDAGPLPARAPRRRGALRLRASARTPGSSSSSRRRSASGRRAAATTASRSRRSRAEARRSRSSACAPASCTGSRSRTRSSSAARYADRDYAARRKDAFIVAVNCFEPSGTCFCVSMGTGPKADAGYDLALTEILDGTHRLLVEVGTERGAEVLAELPSRGAEPADLDAAARGRRGRRPSGWAGASTRPTSATCSRATSRATAGTRSRRAASPAATARSSARPASARASRTSPT